MGNIMEKLELTAQSMYCKKIEELTPAELHYSLGKAVMGEIAGNWEASKIKHDSERRAYYFSAEFLMGRMMYNNLYCLGILEDVTKLLKKKGIDINVFEDIDDAALGNGGLGRLAACFLDSAATQEVPLDGYGIRYKYGLYKLSNLVDVLNDCLCSCITRSSLCAEDKCCRSPVLKLLILQSEVDCHD